MEPSASDSLSGSSPSPPALYSNVFVFHGNKAWDYLDGKHIPCFCFFLLLGSGNAAFRKGGIIQGKDWICQLLPMGLGMGTSFPGAHKLGLLFRFSGCNSKKLFFFWPHSPPGTETTMIRRQHVPGEPPGPPAEDTHRTVGTTVVNKVGMEPSRSLDAVGDWLHSCQC